MACSGQSIETLSHLAQHNNMVPRDVPSTAPKADPDEIPSV